MRLIGQNDGKYQTKTVSPSYQAVQIPNALNGLKISHLLLTKGITRLPGGEGRRDHIRRGGRGTGGEEGDRG